MTLHIAWLLVGLGVGYALRGRTLGRTPGPTSPTARRRIVVPNETRSQVVKNPKFAALLRLGRMVNLIRFAQMGGYEPAPRSSPHGDRQMIGSFLVQTAFLQEVIETLPRLSQHLRDLPAWQAHIVPLLRSTKVKRLQGDTLKYLRNKVVFHFDPSVIDDGLEGIDLPELVVFSADGTARRDVYYPLADEVAIRFLVPDDGLSQSEHTERLKDWIAEVTDLSLAVGHTVEKVVLEACLDLGLTPRMDSLSE